MGPWFLVGAAMHFSHFLVVLLRPTAYSTRTRTCFMAMHATITALLPVLRFRSLATMGPFYNPSNHSSPLRAFLMLCLGEPVMHCLRATTAMLPFKHYVLYACVRLTVDINVVLPAISALLASDKAVMAVSATACDKLQTLLSPFTPVPRGPFYTNACSVAHHVYVAAAAVMIIGHAIPFLAAYWLELVSKLEFLKQHVTQQHCAALPDASILVPLAYLHLIVALCVAGYVAHVLVLLQ
jgi:hypothetical protein